MTLQPLGPGSVLHALVSAATGGPRADAVLALLEIDPALHGTGDKASRAQMAMALNAALFADLLDRVPSAARYVDAVRAQGRRITFDHGALRTIDGATGALPNGFLAFRRILEPLGYTVAGIYPLPRLRMTGRAFCHADLPETIPQFFVSELHCAELPVPAQHACSHVFERSTDPLGETETGALRELAEAGEIALDVACAALPGLVAAFGRQHPEPFLDDYTALLHHSKEAAWIATEGNAFNHATDRVPDVVALAADLKAQGLRIKAEVEVSANRRVRQTALIADTVGRRFRMNTGGFSSREVPGSFYEFISRDALPEGGLDLTFDSGNATGIFAVTGGR